MAKRIDIVYDLIFFIQRIKEKDRQQFKKYLSTKKNKEDLLKLYKAFERCDKFAEPKGIIKRVINFREGKDYRLFRSLRSHLFRYEISNKRIQYFKYKDPHEYLYIQLKGGYIAAQMMTEQDAYITSIYQMTETYRRAERFEVLNIQKDCAENLSKFYELSGDELNAAWWAKEREGVRSDLDRYEDIHNDLEKKLLKITCCESHELSFRSNGERKVDSKIRKIAWMVRLIDWSHQKIEYPPDRSFEISNGLYRELKKNPGMFPKHFRIIVLKYVLEDLYRLGRTDILGQFAKKIYRLEDFPVYQRLPLLKFFLYFLLKSRNDRIMDLVLKDLEDEKSYDQFRPFHDHAVKVKCLYLIRIDKSTEALQVLSAHLSQKISCEFMNFDFRYIEMICFYKLRKWEILEDKLESFRRFTFRQNNIRNSSYHLILFNNLRSLLLHGKIDTGIQSIKQDENVYDLREYTARQLISIARSKNAYHPHNQLNKAAEKHIKTIRNQSDQSED